MEIKKVKVSEFKQPETTSPFFNITVVTSRLYRVPRVTEHYVLGVMMMKRLRYTLSGKPRWSNGMRLHLKARKGSESGRALSLATRGDVVNAWGYLCPEPYVYRGSKIFIWTLMLSRIEVMGQMPMVRRTRKMDRLEAERARELAVVRELEAKRKRLPEAEEIADSILDDLDFEV